MDKRSILDRMLRKAAGYLGLKRNESLDTVVTLFIKSFGEEIYKLSGEINNIEERLSESLLSMLNPDISLLPMPAHCILHAAAEEGEVILSKETLFTTEYKKTANDRQSMPLSFCPTSPAKIRQGDIRYIINNGLCYSVDAYRTKTLISRSRNTDFSNRKSVWIGLSLGENIDTPDGISFYFDLPGISNKEEYLNILQYSAWNMNGKPLILRQGLNVIEPDAKNGAAGLFSPFDVSVIIDEYISSFYENHFLTITSDAGISEARTLFPECLKEYFPSRLMDDFTESLIWIEINFPQSFTSSVIESLSISINAFPVANKTLHIEIIELNELLPVIPLKTANGESFISIHSIIDSQGREYCELPYDDSETKIYRSYSVRRGGYERYGKRDALEYLTNLSNTLENQNSLLFSDSADDDWAADIQQQIYELAKQVKKAVSYAPDKAEIQNYIHIDQLKGNEIFFVKYWTTNCVQANGIKQDTWMECLTSDMHINSDSVFSLSPAIGGRKAPQSVERQNLRMKSLTQGAVITGYADIREFCTTHFKDTYQYMEVKKGLMPLDYPQYGFANTIDIHLTPRSGLNHSFGEEDRQKVKQLLVKNSPATFNYRIFINSQK